MKGKNPAGICHYVCCMLDILYKNKYMETLMKRSFFVLIALLGMTTLHAQSVDDIVGKYVDALGGKDVLASVKSMIIESTVDVAGNEAPSTTTILVGQGYKSVTDFNGTQIIQCINSTGGWSVNPMAGQNTPTAMPADLAKASQMQLQLSPLANYAANGYKVEMIGKDSSDYKLRMTAASATVTYYINAKTYLIDKLVTQSAAAQGQETTITFSDYKKTDGGYIFPFAQSLELPQFTLTITHKKVTVNPTIDPTIFNMPK
jgi:Domain of unknown function (DUF4292)